MGRGLRRQLSVLAVTAVAVGAFAGLAGASGIQLSVSPAHIKPGGTVTITTTPRVACTLTITIAKKPFSHGMPHGWLQITMSRKDVPGRVPVKVVCGGSLATGAFTVSR